MRAALAARCCALAAIGAHGADFDVVVYGSTPAGIAAATTAGQLGLSVAVYEPLTMIGGMGAAGALALHDGPSGELTGTAKVFAMLNGAAYNLSSPVLQPESFVAEVSFFRMLHNASVKTVKTDCHVTGAKTAKGADGVSRIESVSLSCLPDPVTATVFIDASYDGDVMTAAGDVPYTWGREANTTYNETLAGARVPGWTGVGGPKNVSALADDGSIIKYVANLSELGPPGSADDALMAFQHRMCISEGDDMVPWPKPDDYNPDDFILIQRAVDASGGSADAFTRMPPGAYHGYPGPKKKYDLCCGITVAASDQPMLNKGWANASWEERQKITDAHTYFELGTFYYLANDPRVPEKVRAQFSKYGLCKDEFVDNGNVPVQLYVRISNRMVSDFVITQNNIGNPRSKPDGIAIGDWSFDEHMTGKYAVPDGNGGYTVMLEGNFWPGISQGCPGAGPGGNWYEIPYRALVPKRGTGGNLLVPVCFSASAVAYASTRIESMFMAVGAATGVAAKQVVDGSAATVQDVNVTLVQELLTTRFDQRVHGPPGGPSPPAGPTPSYYNVSGAGSVGWDGKYVRAAGKGGLTYTSTEPRCADCSLYSNGGVWRLAIEGKELYYVASDASSLPPLTGWTTANGSAPAPTLTAGPPSE